MKTNATRLLDTLGVRYELRVRGTQIVLMPAHYVRATKAKIGAIARSEGSLKIPEIGFAARRLVTIARCFDHAP